MKTPVLITRKYSDRASLLGYLWKSIGYRPILIYVEESPVYEVYKFFDAVIKAQNSLEAVIIATRIKNTVFHYLNYAPDDIGALLANNGIPYIYDYKDLYAGVRNLETPQAVRDLEVLIVSSAKAHTYRDGQLQRFIDKNQINKRFESNFVPDYYIERTYSETSDAAAQDDKIRIVLTGGVESDEHPTYDYGGVGKILPFLLGEKFEVTIVGGFSGNSRIGEVSANPIFSLLTRRFSNLKIAAAMKEQEFHEQLFNYDFAALLTNGDFFDCDDDKSGLYENGSIQHCASARVFSFMEAGLPTLVGEHRTFLCNAFKNNPYIVRVARSDLDGLSSCLRILKHARYKENIAALKTQSSASGLIPNFSEFISRLVS